MRKKRRSLEVIQADIDAMKPAVQALYAERRAIKAHLVVKAKTAEERRKQRQIERKRLVPILEAPLYDDISTIALDAREYRQLRREGVKRIGHLFVMPADQLRRCMHWGRSTLDDELIALGIARRGGKRVKEQVSIPADIVAEYEAWLQQRDLHLRQKAAEAEAAHRVTAAEREAMRRKHAEELAEFHRLKKAGMAFRIVGDPDTVFIQVRLQHGGKYRLEPGFWVAPVHAERFIGISERAADLEIDSLEEATATAERLLATLN